MQPGEQAPHQSSAALVRTAAGGLLAMNASITLLALAWFALVSRAFDELQVHILSFGLFAILVACMPAMVTLFVLLPCARAAATTRGAALAWAVAIVVEVGLFLVGAYGGSGSVHGVAAWLIIVPGMVFGDLTAGVAGRAGVFAGLVLQAVIGLWVLGQVGGRAAPRVGSDTATG